MILRVAAGLSLALGATALAAFLHALGRGPMAPLASSHLREMKDRVDVPAAYEQRNFADIAALPHGRPVAEYSALERRGVSVEGYVQRMLRSPDGDFHLELVAQPKTPDHADTSYFTAEITPAFQRGSETWRYEPLVAALHPNHAGRPPWTGGPRRVRLSGWLLYDYQYDPAGSVQATPRLRMPRIPSTLLMTGWEIHPVTRIEVLDEQRGWREVRR